MGAGANLQEANYQLVCQEGKDWFEEPFGFVYTDAAGVQHNEDFSTLLGANMYFKPSGQPNGSVVKFSTTHSPPELTLTQASGGLPPMISVTCLAAQQLLTQGNWDFALYTINASNAEEIQLVGVVVVGPYVGGLT